MDILKRKLTIEEQNAILQPLFGLEFIDISEKGVDQKPNFVLFDCDMEEFYAFDKNLKFDFSTLEGIFKYARYLGNVEGYGHCQFDFNSVLNISPYKKYEKG
jgi:hypothetical protein